MCEETDTSPEQAGDGLAALGNANHWSSWIAHLGERIESDAEPEKPLTDAAAYVAWLLLSAENICYGLRWHLYVASELQDGKVFDLSYSGLLSAVTPRMPSEVAADAEFAIRVRHILVHKGFPNPQAAPTRRRGEFSEEDVWDVRGTITRPSSYHEIKARLDSVLQWISSNTPGTQFGL